jgi:hypothetical protein
VHEVCLLALASRHLLQTCAVSAFANCLPCIKLCRVPGQFVAARYCSHDQGSGSTDECSEMVVARRLLSLASSPYEARRDSALLDASLVELLVSRTGA